MSTIQQFGSSADLMRALLWQYNDAERLQKLLEQKQAWYDANHKQFWLDWYRDVFDLRTANEFGLAIWGIILGLNLYVETPPTIDDTLTFGFDDYFVPFDQGSFGQDVGGTVSLSKEMQRIALRLRYYQLVSSGTVPETNRMLADVFKDLGRVYLLDGLNMTQTYVFTFVPSADLRYLLDNFDILPRPAGVKSTYYVVGEQCFGFDEYSLNFDNGSFGA